MLTKSVTQGTAWLMGGRLMGQALGFIALVITARLLSQDDFGLMALAMAVMLLVGAILELPTAAALVHFENPTREDFDTAWTLGVLRGVLVSLLLFSISWPVARFYEDDRLHLIMVMISTYPLILGLRNSYMEEYTRALQFGPEAISEISIKVASFIVTVAIAWAYQSYWALPAGLLASGVAGSAQ